MKGRYPLRRDEKRDRGRDLLRDYYALRPFRSKWTLVRERRKLAHRGWKGVLACREDVGLSQGGWWGERTGTGIKGGRRGIKGGRLK